MKMTRFAFLPVLGALFAMSISGCASFSGLSGSKADLACKAPEGVICTSVTEIYENSLEGSLPAQKPKAPIESKGQINIQPVPEKDDQVRAISPRDLTTPSSGDPIRLAPLVLRMWIAPWEDTDGDLHDQHYIYTVLDKGKWLIEVNQQAIRDAFKPVYPLGMKNEPDKNKVEPIDAERMSTLNLDSGSTKP